MENDQLKELLLKSLTAEIDDRERSLIESGIVPVYSFSNGFRDRVMQRLNARSIPVFLRPDFLRSFDLGFRRVALTGVAAILILVVTMLLSQGSLSYDTLLGIDNQIDDSLISLLVDN